MLQKAGFRLLAATAALFLNNPAEEIASICLLAPRVKLYG
jgi:hypothetical protein